MEDPKHNIPIDEYLLGRLTEEEARKVEQALRENPDLAAAANLEAEVLKGATLHGQNQLRQRLRVIQANFEDKAEKATPSINYYLAIAAGIAALVLFAYLLLGRGPNTEKIFAEYYNPYPISFTERGEKAEEDLLVLSQLYEEEKYAEAIPVLEKLLESRDEDGQLKLALGIAYLETGQLETAQNIFQNIRAEGILLYKDLAVWYLALTLIKADEVDRAKQWLQVLADDPEADKNVEAQKLLLELR